jgi:hypothetical protein
MYHFLILVVKGTINERKLSDLDTGIVGRNSFATALNILEVLHVECDRSFMPSLNRASFKFLTQANLTSYQRMLLVVPGKKPRKIPFQVQTGRGWQGKDQGGGPKHDNQT